MQLKTKNLLFFNIFAKTVFFSIAGLFGSLSIIFIGLFLVFTQGIYAELSIFFTVGFLVFFINYFLFKNKYFKTFKIPSYKTYIETNKKLKFGIFMSFNLYLMLCGYIMIILGVYEGFGFYYSNNPNVKVLIDSPLTVQLTGIVLGITHSFVLFVYFFLGMYIKRFVILSHEKLNFRRKQIETARVEAKSVYN